jgi:hypothetical protein
MKFTFETQFWEYLPCFQSTKLCLTTQKLCLLEHISINILKLDNTNPIFPTTVTLCAGQALQQNIFLSTALINIHIYPLEITNTTVSTQVIKKGNMHIILNSMRRVNMPAVVFAYH